MSQFGRIYEMLVGPAGSTSKLISRTDNATESLRVTFEIHKTTKEHPNKSLIKIYNLAPASQAALVEKPDTRCVFQAGYGEGAGLQLLFAGDVTFGYTVRQGSDYVTILELGDGHVLLRDSTVSISVPAGGTAHQVIQQAAKAIGLPLDMDSEAPNRTYRHGFSFYGAARHALRKGTRSAGLEWSVQNEKIQVIPPAGTTPKKAFVIEADSGLIRSPERKREGVREVAKVPNAVGVAAKSVLGPKPHFDGWRVRSLLLPTVVPGDTVILNSLAVQGAFKVDAIIQRGDSHQGEWISEIDLLLPVDYAAKAAQVAAKGAHKGRKKKAAP